MSNFVQLHQHSECSFLDGYARVDQIAQRAKELGQQAVALTDHGEVNGHLAFQKACKKLGIKPVLGMEGYWVSSIPETRKAQGKNSHITLLAQNQKGLQNLWAWSSFAYEPQNFYSKPLADLSWMKDYAEGLYASDGCLLTEFARCIIEEGDEGKAREVLGKLLNVFGDSFFMELHTWQFLTPQTEREYKLNREMTALNKAKVRFATELGVPLVVVNDAHYAWPKDWENHALVWQFNTKQNSDQTDRGQTAAWMMGDDELVLYMGNHGISRSVTEEAIANSFAIAENCNVEIHPTLEMPRLTASDRDDILMFCDTLEKGFQKLVVDKGLDEELYRARMEDEAKFIADRNFCGYFNIVSDYVNAAKSGTWKKTIHQLSEGKSVGLPGYDRPSPIANEPMLVGPGRGSAGGSLVAYLLGITTVDPLKYDLLFSRFLAPGRKGLPDIDVDVPQSKRPDMKRYLEARYRHDHVCGIGTRNRSQARGTLADLCRVQGISWDHRMKMSKILDEVADIDEGNEDSWDHILAEKGGELAPWVQEYPDLFKKMGEMVGLARHSGTHAAGVLVSSKPIRGNLPTRIKKDQVVTQFDMHEVEELGGVKLDLLGLRHLDTLDVARRLIHERHGKLLDYYAFDEEFRDPAIWDQIDEGQTVGIFQLETSNGTKVATEFKCRSEVDVAVVSAINRPGVIRAGLLNHYLWRRQGLEEVSFDHPLMESIVGDTYGILIYQEQLIQAVQVLAGFTPIEADDLRKLVGKKEIERLAPMKEKFLQGCLAHSRMDLKVANKIWTSFEASGSYLFNKSHAVEYATISTWEVWTKHYYPTEFLVALMQTDAAGINKYVREARRRNIRIFPPDINLSERKFTICDDGIRYGLDSVFGVGGAATDDILPNRPYKSLEDYLERTQNRGGAKKNVIINLIKIGAFDCFGDRGDLLQKFYDSRKDCGGESVPDFSDEKVVYDIEQKLVGNYVTIDPMAKYLNMIDKTCIRHPSDMLDIDFGDGVNIGGQITKIRRLKTKRGKDMAFITLLWNEEEFQITVFPEAWQECRKLLKVGAPVACRCLRDDKGVHLSHLERLDWLLNDRCEDESALQAQG